MVFMSIKKSNQLLNRMQLRSGLKTSSAIMSRQTQVVKPQIEQKFNLEKSISNYMSELMILNNNKHDLIKHFDDDEYWSNVARLVIELIHILDENMESISGTTFTLDEYVDLVLYYKRQLLRAIEKVDFEYKNDILMNNVIYDINNFVEKVERNS